MRISKFKTLRDRLKVTRQQRLDMFGLRLAVVARRRLGFGVIVPEGRCVFFGIGDAGADSERTEIAVDLLEAHGGGRRMPAAEKSGKPVLFRLVESNVRCGIGAQNILLLTVLSRDDLGVGGHPAERLDGIGDGGEPFLFEYSWVARCQGRDDCDLSFPVGLIGRYPPGCGRLPRPSELARATPRIQGKRWLPASLPTPDRRARRTTPAQSDRVATTSWCEEFFHQRSSAPGRQQPPAHVTVCAPICNGQQQRVRIVVEHRNDNAFERLRDRIAENAIEMLVMFSTARGATGADTVLCAGRRRGCGRPNTAGSAHRGEGKWRQRPFRRSQSRLVQWRTRGERPVSTTRRYVRAPSQVLNDFRGPRRPRRWQRPCHDARPPTRWKIPPSRGRSVNSKSARQITYCRSGG